jgi:hypothetical protein
MLIALMEGQNKNKEIKTQRNQQRQLTQDKINLNC